MPPAPWLPHCTAMLCPPPLKIDRMDPAGELGRKRGDRGEDALRKRLIVRREQADTKKGRQAGRQTDN